MVVQVRSLFGAQIRNAMKELKKKIETQLQDWEAFSRDYMVGFKGYTGKGRYEHGRIDAYRQVLMWIEEAEEK